MSNKHIKDVEIPRKKYFKIGEVANMFGVESHTLRFWEKQFSILTPKRNRNSGHRTYTRKEVEMIKDICDLLYNQNFTNKGAAQKLQEIYGSLNKKDSSIIQNSKLSEDQLIEIKEELEGLKNLIEEL